MQCSDVLELIEPIAAGEVTMADAVRVHIETCPGCAGALASARRLETMLAAIEAPPAPSNFTNTVLQRIRRQRWQSEQHVDRLFNIAIGFALAVVAGAVVALLNVEAVFSVTATAWALVKESMRDMMRDAAPTVTTYVAAAGLLASAFAMWWWAERRWLY